MHAASHWSSCIGTRPRTLAPKKGGNASAKTRSSTTYGRSTPRPTEPASSCTARARGSPSRRRARRWRSRACPPPPG
eukprot:11155485-Lingulodinium_polyedra.AAC.1